MGLRQPGCPRGAAHGRERRRQYRRTADGDRRASLWRHPPERIGLAGSRRDRPRPARRSANDLFRRHAPAPADRTQSRQQSAAGLHGRTNRRSRRLGAGPPARPAAWPGGPLPSLGGAGHARSRRRAAPHPSPDGDAGRQRGRGRAHRPGAGRSAARLHADARRLDSPGMKIMSPVLRVAGLAKSFFMHAQGGLELSVLRDVELDVAPGECLALVGPSGAGKSTLLRSLYGNYRPQRGSIRVRHGDGDEEKWVELVNAEPRITLDVRRHTMGFVSQFLRVIPRVATVDVVAEPMLRLGASLEEARQRAEFLLSVLVIPERLWSLPPATFSGGEQQRVNIARGLIAEHPILLLDEPTASLDAENRDVVAELITEARKRGAAIAGIFHDEDTRNKVATRRLELQPPLRH